MDEYIEELADTIAGLRADIEELRTKLAQMIQVGPVAEIDSEKGYRVQLGLQEDGSPFLSPWLPHPETGKTSIPLKMGQPVGVLSPNADPRQALLLRGGYGGDNTSQNDDMQANVFKDAGVTVSVKGGRLQIEAEQAVLIKIGGVTHEISAQGAATNGGRIEHDGKNVGSTHVHSGIFPGKADTQGPH
ncbi:phage baseplate assembly protein V [Polycladidibacter hongkongensis]|uniref:phage baseplate assembly protein V n=1 Tax=Polycladidibacter hongkongensis TaxID=1647556 RepID=UPI00082CE907|nr:phage baseplate assembly protein V [Pseudovibrio hongkongensis]